MAESKYGILDGQNRMTVTEGLWTFDEDDWLLIAMLQDPVHMSELLFEDPNNHEYSGTYHVQDHQYPLFRPPAQESGFPCGRGIGKTESIKARSVCHAFKRQRQDMLVTAPEQIHLDPLTDQIEARIRDTRLTFEFLDTRNQKTGFTHKPFQCDFIDGTKIIGRIPKITGTGVKGQHVTDLIIDEGQDYPEKGWIEVFPTVMRDHTDNTGEVDFTFTFYGVHTGARDGKFYSLSHGGDFRIHTVTQVMAPWWTERVKRSTAAMYGGTQTSDYRRNVLGEAGGAGSAFFVTSRLMACIDQDRDSAYNTVEYKGQEFQAEQLDSMLPDSTEGRHTYDAAYADLLREIMDLPDGLGQQVYVGGDLGLVNDPTVLTLWAIGQHQRKNRLKLVRMFHLWRFREKQIRQALYTIGFKYGATLRGVGLDITGLGLPIFQAIEDDEVAPQHLIDVTRGYVFSAKVPVGIDTSLVTQDSSGRMRDQYGSIVEVVEDPNTMDKIYVVKMSMIEASTRYLRDWVDSGWMLLPFDTKIAGDFQAETTSRVKAMAGVRKKPNAFHILDSARAFAMVYKQANVDEQLKVDEQRPVLARAIAQGDPMMYPAEVMV